MNARRLAAELLAKRNADAQDSVCALLQFAQQVRPEAPHALPERCICLRSFCKMCDAVRENGCGPVILIFSKSMAAPTI